jgi:hypothetical protein
MVAVRDFSATENASFDGAEKQLGQQYIFRLGPSPRITCSESDVFTNCPGNSAEIRNVENAR